MLAKFRLLIPCFTLLPAMLPVCIYTNTFMRPQALTSYPAILPQVAVSIPGHVVWADFALLRRDFPGLCNLSDNEIEAILIKDFSVLTLAQFKTRDLLMKFEYKPTLRTIFHPPTYKRASVASFSNKNIKGLVDLKGTGVNAFGSSTLEKLRYFRAQIEDAFAFSSENSLFEFWQEDYLKVSKVLESFQRTASDPQASDLERKRARHDTLHTARRVKSFTMMMELIEQVRSGTLEKDQALQTFDEHLRSLDYTNGAFSLAKAFKEVLVQRATQLLFNEYNQNNGTNFQTVENYFIIALQGTILGPHGVEEPAAILGRQAHWRNEKFATSGELSYPPSLLSPVLKRADQADVFNAVVDFEIPEILDSRVKEFFAVNSLGVHPVERLSADAATRYASGETGAFSALLDRLLKPLSSIPYVVQDQAVLSQQSKLAEFEQDIIELQTGSTKPDRILQIMSSMFVDSAYARHPRFDVYIALATERFPKELTKFWANRLAQIETNATNGLGVSLRVLAWRDINSFRSLIERIKELNSASKIGLVERAVSDTLLQFLNSFASISVVLPPYSNDPTGIDENNVSDHLDEVVWFISHVLELDHNVRNHALKGDVNLDAINELAEIIAENSIITEINPELVSKAIRLYNGPLHPETLKILNGIPFADTLQKVNVFSCKDFFSSSKSNVEVSK